MGKRIISQILDDDENPELEKVKDELEIEKAKTTALALKEFEEQKSALLETIKDDEKREEVSELIQSGADLERVKATIDIIQSGLSYGLSQHETQQKKKPSGQAKMWSPSNADVQTWDSVESMVNEIYDNLEIELFKKEMSKNYDVKKLKHYQNLADRLMNSMITGMRNRESTNIGKFTIMQCKACGKIVTGGESVCPVCNKKVMVGTVRGW